jgi:glycosyltransferase involved in cell wall biosynthesis
VKRLLLSAIKLVYSLTWRKLYWPDAASGWIWPALERARELHRNQRFDAMITVSHPFSGHMVGLAMKKEWQSLRWVADMGDPFSLLSDTPVNNSKLYARRNREAERQVLQSCDRAAVTTPETLELYREAFPEEVEKMTVIGPLLSASECNDRKASSPLTGRDGVATLLFVGTLYGGIRSPEPLLRVVKVLRQSVPVELHLIGKMLQCDDHFEPYRDDIGSSLFIHGELPREEALAAMHDCTALVNIGNETSFQLPSKIVEYAATGKPIVNFAHIEQDSSAQFLSRHGCFLNVPPFTPGEESNVAQRLEEFLSRAQPLSPEEIEPIVGPHRLPAIAASYEELLH